MMMMKTYNKQESVKQSQTGGALQDAIDSDSQIRGHPWTIELPRNHHQCPMHPKINHTPVKSCSGHPKLLWENAAGKTHHLKIHHLTRLMRVKMLMRNNLVCASHPFIPLTYPTSLIKTNNAK